MNPDASALIDKVRRDPEFQLLVRQRTTFAWGLSAAMAAIYFGFILVVAFAPKLLGTPIAGGVITIGIPLGVGVILAAFALTGLYVRRANGRFDPMTRRIVERAK